MSCCFRYPSWSQTPPNQFTECSVLPKCVINAKKIRVRSLWFISNRRDLSPLVFIHITYTPISSTVRLSGRPTQPQWPDPFGLADVGVVIIPNHELGTSNSYHFYTILIYHHSKRKYLRYHVFTVRLFVVSSWGTERVARSNGTPRLTKHHYLRPMHWETECQYSYLGTPVGSCDSEFGVPKSNNTPCNCKLECIIHVGLLFFSSFHSLTDSCQLTANAF